MLPSVRQRIGCDQRHLQGITQALSFPRVGAARSWGRRATRSLFWVKLSLQTGVIHPWRRPSSWRCSAPAWRRRELNVSSRSSGWSLMLFAQLHVGTAHSQWAAVVHHEHHEGKGTALNYDVPMDPYFMRVGCGLSCMVAHVSCELQVHWRWPPGSQPWTGFCLSSSTRCESQLACCKQ